MTKLNKLLATTAFAALLAGGLAVAPHEAFATGTKNPGVPASMKVSNPCAPKPTNVDKSCKSDTGKDESEKSKSYELLFPQQPGQNG